MEVLEKTSIKKSYVALPIWHKNKIQRITIGGYTYLTTVAEICKKKIWDRWITCQLMFIRNPEGRLALGYAIQTIGFQLVSGVNPIISDLTYLDEITDIQIKKQQFLIFSRYEQNNDLWRFRFNSKILINKWTSLLYELKFSQENNQNVGRMFRSSLKQESIQISRIQEQINLNHVQIQVNRQAINRGSQPNNHEINLLKRQLQSKQQTINHLKAQIDKLKSQALDNIDILEETPEYRVTLKKAIEHETGKSIRRTRLLLTEYNPRRQGQVNYFTHLSGKQNLLVIIKTCNNFYLAGFSELPANKAQKPEKKGLLVSLSNSKVFPLLSNKKALTIQGNALMFGKYELVLRVSESRAELYSSLGRGDGHYDSKGQNYKKLMGEIGCGRGQQIMVSVAGYEIHEVILQQQS